MLMLSIKSGLGTNVFHAPDFVKYGTKNKDYFLPTRSSKIFLHAARNETIAFQIVLTDIPKTTKQISVDTSDFKGNSILKKKNIELFLLKNCQRTYSADGLIPFEPGELISFQISELDYLVIWFDLYVPSIQHPGLYKGNIDIWLGKEKLEKVEIELTVYPFQLPVIPSLKTDLNNYGVGFVKEWKCEIGSGKGYKIETAFYQMARKSRMTFNPLPYRSQRGNPFPTMAPSIAGKGDNIHISDWSEYDKRYGPYFSGTAFGNGIPIDHQYLPFNPEWPSDFSNYVTARETYEKEWNIIAGKFIKHFEEKGWNNTGFQIYLNQKPRPNNRIPWRLDEPLGGKDYKALRYYADLTHKIFSIDNKGKFKFRIDIGHFYCDKHKGNPLKDFRVNEGNKILSPIDIWAISKHSMDNNIAQEEALKLKKHRKTIYEYMTAPRINDPLAKSIKYGWSAWVRNEDGIIFWNTVKNKNKESDGKDFLIYTGVKFGINGPISSLRLKAIRRGIQDYEYIKLASQYKREEVSNIVKKCDLYDFGSYKKCIKKLANIIISSKH